MGPTQFILVAGLAIIVVVIMLRKPKEAKPKGGASKPISNSGTTSTEDRTSEKDGTSPEDKLIHNAE